jgi:hypothetical protein
MKKLKESPDKVDLVKSGDRVYYDEYDAIAFGMVGDNMYIGAGETHYEIASNVKEEINERLKKDKNFIDKYLKPEMAKHIKKEKKDDPKYSLKDLKNSPWDLKWVYKEALWNYLDEGHGNLSPDEEKIYNAPERESFKLHGRLWDDKKIISFWGYPKNSFELKKVISLLEQKLNKKMWNQGWIIDIYDRNEGVYHQVPLEKYDEGLYGVDVKGQEQDHVKSPLLKKQKGPTYDKWDKVRQEPAKVNFYKNKNLAENKKQILKKKFLKEIKKSNNSKEIELYDKIKKLKAGEERKKYFQELISLLKDKFPNKQIVPSLRYIGQLLDIEEPKTY